MGCLRLRDVSIGAGLEEAARVMLRETKDQYRNPVMHPDLSIGSIDHSFALLDLINTAVGLMLGKIVRQSRGTL